MGEGPESTDESRLRTVRGVDPKIVAAPARTLSGMEFLQKLDFGELPPPPIVELLGRRLVALEPSVARFEIDPAEYRYHPIGSVHGGVVTALLDSAMGCAFPTTLPAGVGSTTLELKVGFVRPVLDRSGTLRAEGKVIHAGSTVATAEARLVDPQGSLFAHAMSTILIRRATPPS